MIVERDYTADIIIQGRCSNISHGFTGGVFYNYRNYDSDDKQQGTREQSVRSQYQFH